MQVPPSQPPPDPVGVAGVEFCALLHQQQLPSWLTYQQLSERTDLSRGSVGNYLTKLAPRRGNREQLLDALGVAAEDRAREVELHRQTLSAGTDAAAVSCRTRARAAGCTAWPRSEFTAGKTSEHPAVGRRTEVAGQHAAVPPPHVRARDSALRRSIAAAAASEIWALIVIRGTFSTGKSRSFWAAVREICSGWVACTAEATNSAVAAGVGLLTGDGRRVACPVRRVPAGRAEEQASTGGRDRKIRLGATYCQKDDDRQTCAVAATT